MFKTRVKAFFLSFLFTLCMLMPMAAIVRWNTALRSRTVQAAAQPTQTMQPGANANHRTTLLVCVADKEQLSFVLLRLDAVAGQVELAAVPQESVVLTPGGSETLETGYRTAGPARAAQRLRDTLGIRIDRYLALSPAVLEKLMTRVGKVSYSLAGAFSARRLQELSLNPPMRQETLAEAEVLLRELQAQGRALPTEAAAARAAAWDALFRQRRENLARYLAAALRSVSGSVLTDLTAVDLYHLGETLDYLAAGEPEPESGVLPGVWAADTGRYEFDETTVAYVQSRFSSAASAADSAQGRAP